MRKVLMIGAGKNEGGRKMSGKVAFLAFVSIVLLSTALLATLSSRLVTTASPKIWIVAKKGPADFRIIQEAINAASPRDEIHVMAGKYEENITIYKELTLVAVDGSDLVEIDALSANKEVAVTISSSYVTLENFTITGGKAIVNTAIGIASQEKRIYEIVIRKNRLKAAYYAIQNRYPSDAIHELVDLRISENKLEPTVTGLYLSNSRSLVVNNNTFVGCLEPGTDVRTAIELHNAAETQVLGNNLYDFPIGILLQEGRSNDITNNNFTDITSVCIVDVGSSSRISHNLISRSSSGVQIGGNSSTICQNMIVQGKGDGIAVTGFDNNVSSNTITDGWAKGVHSHNSLNNVFNNTIQRVVEGIYGGASILDNDLTNCATAVHIPNNRNATVVTNDFCECELGVRVEGNATISSNFFLNCEHGVRVEGNASEIASNILLSCPFAVHIMEGANGNVVSRNMLLNSTAADDNEKSRNHWDKGNQTGGNYWFDYENEDRNNDGFGDTAYLIYDEDHNGSTNKDNYPLIVPPYPIPVYCKMKQRGVPCTIEAKVTILGNLTVSRFTLDEKTKIIVFNVTGNGYCNITFPTELLSGAFDSSIGHTCTWTETGITLHFTYQNSATTNIRVEAQTKIVGDIDGSGKVDIVDFTKMAKKYLWELG